MDEIEVDVTEVRLRLLTESTEIYVQVYEGGEGSHIWHMKEFGNDVDPTKLLARVWLNKDAVLSWERKSPVHYD